MKVKSDSRKAIGPDFEQGLGDFLRLQFEIRRNKNSKFSMRSFAKLLELDQSLLSKVLSGKRKLSSKSIQKCLEALKVSEDEIKRFTLQKSKGINYSKLNEEVFEFISEWYHFAILELMTVQDFVLTPANAAHHLGISEKESELAIDRLKKLGFIKLFRGKFVLRKSNNTWFSDDKTSEARKNLHRQLLLKSLQALDEVPFELREHTSMTLAINREYLPEIKRIIVDASQELATLMQRSTPFHEVYQLTINFFPTKIP